MWFSQHRMKEKPGFNKYALDFQKQLQCGGRDFTTSVSQLEREKKNVVSQITISQEKLS